MRLLFLLVTSVAYLLGCHSWVRWPITACLPPCCSCAAFLAGDLHCWPEELVSKRERSREGKGSALGRVGESSGKNPLPLFHSSLPQQQQKGLSSCKGSNFAGLISEIQQEKCGGVALFQVTYFLPILRMGGKHTAGDVGKSPDVFLLE